MLQKTPVYLIVIQHCFFQLSYRDFLCTPAVFDDMAKVYLVLLVGNQGSRHVTSIYEQWKYTLWSGTIEIHSF